MNKVDSVETVLNLVLAEEDSRQKLARELHDGPLQYCVAALLRLQAADPPLPVVEERVRTAIRGLKDIGCRLFPDTLGHFGLADTVDRLANKCAREQAWQLELELCLRGAEMHRAFELSIVRLVQQVLDLATSHAHTTCVTISLRRQGDEVLFAARRQGSSEEPSSECPELNMLGRRLTALGGWCRLQHGAGLTQVESGIPLTQDAQP